MARRAVLFVVMAATIKLASSAPEGAGYLTVGNAFINVSGGPEDTSDLGLVAVAQALPYFDVEVHLPEIDATQPKPDQSDPQVNPGADHLSSLADPAVVAAAAANEAAIKGETKADTKAAEPAPSVKDAVQGTLGTAAPDAAAKFVDQPSFAAPPVSTPDAPASAGEEKH